MGKVYILENNCFMPAPKDRHLKPINSLFEKYQKRLQPPQAVAIATFCEVVEDILSVPLEPSRVAYNVYNRTLQLKVSGVRKTEILLRKDELLTHLRGRLGSDKSPTNII